MVGAVGRLRDDVPRHRAGIRLGELLRVVGEQALGDELQQHVVVALERGVDVEVRPEADHAVLGEEPGAARRLARLLQGLERVPRGQRLERRGDRLEVLAVVVGVGAPENTASNFTRNSSCAKICAYVVASCGSRRRW